MRGEETERKAGAGGNRAVSAPNGCGAAGAAPWPSLPVSASWGARSFARFPVVGDARRRLTATARRVRAASRPYTWMPLRKRMVVDIGAGWSYHLVSALPLRISRGASAGRDPARSGRPRPCQSPRPRTASWDRGDSALPREIAPRPPRPTLYPLGCSPVMASVARSLLGANRRTPARPLSVRRLRHRLRAGSTTLARTIGCSDRTRRDRDSLGAGNSTAPLHRAGGSASAPTRRGQIAAQVGGGIVAREARRSPAAAGPEGVAGI